MEDREKGSFEAQMGRTGRKETSFPLESQVINKRSRFRLE